MCYIKLDDTDLWCWSSGREIRPHPWTWKKTFSISLENVPPTRVKGFLIFFVCILKNTIFGCRDKIRVYLKNVTAQISQSTSEVSGSTLWIRFMCLKLPWHKEDLSSNCMYGCTVLERLASLCILMGCRVPKFNNQPGNKCLPVCLFFFFTLIYIRTAKKLRTSQPEIPI